MASTLSNDLIVIGNIKSESEIKVEGRVDGELVARLVEIGNKAVIKGKISADQVIVNGHVKGKIFGIQVRLNEGARVEGDIIHETIAIEAGAHFEGTVKRKENPLVETNRSKAPSSTAKPAPSGGGSAPAGSNNPQGKIHAH